MREGKLRNYSPLTTMEWDRLLSLFLLAEKPYPHPSSDGGWQSKLVYKAEQCYRKR